MNALVSVIMSAYNEEAHIAEAIRSILDQTYANLELIIIDDYSTDGTLEVCRTFDDPRIRLHRKTTEPRHLAASRNLGIAMADGEYVAFQDADDVSDPGRIEAQLQKALAKPGRRVVGTAVTRVEGHVRKIMHVPETHDQIIKGFHRTRNRTTIISGTILAPREVLTRVPYRPRFKYMQDWDHMLRLYESHLVELANCPEPLYTYFIRPKGVLQRPDWLDCNIFVRNCQDRRRRHLAEFESVEQFFGHLRDHRAERAKWLTMRSLIKFKNQTHQRRRQLSEAVIGSLTRATARLLG